MNWEIVRGWLALWALIGYFAAGGVSKVTDKRSAVMQWILLGPLFWVGVPIRGLIIKLLGS